MKKMLTTLLLTMLCKLVFAQTISGTASFYHNKFVGRKTATGEVFSNKGLTCACNQLKLGSKVKVTNLKNNKSIILTVNDRLAANNRRVVDVTEFAAKELGFYNAGLGKVSVELVQKKNLQKPEEQTPIIDSISGNMPAQSVAN